MSVFPVQGPVARHVPPAPPSADVVVAGAAVVGPGGAALLEGGAGPLVVVAVLLPLLPSPVPNHSSNNPCPIFLYSRNLLCQCPTYNGDVCTRLERLHGPTGAVAGAPVAAVPAGQRGHVIAAQPITAHLSCSANHSSPVGPLQHALLALQPGRQHELLRELARPPLVLDPELGLPIL